MSTYDSIEEERKARRDTRRGEREKWGKRKEGRRREELGRRGGEERRRIRRKVEGEGEGRRGRREGRRGEGKGEDTTHAVLHCGEGVRAKEVEVDGASVAILSRAAACRNWPIKKISKCSFK